MSDENIIPLLEDDEDYEPDLITLEDENGNEHTFEVVDAADLDDIRYMAMVPYHEDPAQRLAEDAEMIIMRVCDGEDDDEEYLDIVDDENELRKVGAMFVSRLQEIFDIDMDELENQTNN